MRQRSRGIFFVLLVLLLCGCGTTVECIDPDDWGGDFQVSVNSTAAASDIKPVNPADPQGDQYVPWTKGFQLTGKPVIMVVNNAANLTHPINCSDPTNFNSATSSWRFVYANPSLVNSPFACTNGGCSTLALCTFNTPASPYPWFPYQNLMAQNSSLTTASLMATNSLPDTNSPCVLAMGIGLYSVITKDTTAPPGKSLLCGPDMADTTNCLLHIGDGACTDASIVGCTTPFISQGCYAGGAAFVPPTDCQTDSCYIYLKILDTFYADNFGSYSVSFKQGVFNPNNPGIITKFVAMAQGILCSATEDIFNNVINPNGYGGEANPYLSYIRVLLILYIIFIGVGYLTGFVEFTHQELIVRVFKIALVIQLSASASSWNFFYDYFFKFFTNGVGELTGIIFDDAITTTQVSIPGIPTTSSCSFQNLSGFASFDQAFRELLSYQTSRKLLSLLSWKGGGYVGGAILILIFYIMIGVVLFIILKSILIYVVCYLAISMLIVLSPIFIPFILFKATRHWFDAWLKNLISYFIQPIIILTFAFFMLQIFMSQLQYMFGYRVCYKHWFYFVSQSVLDIDVYAWQTDFQVTPTKMCMLTPNSILSQGETPTIQVSQNAMGKASYSIEPWRAGCHVHNNYYTNSGAAKPQYCEPYTCTQERFPDYPYLDPNIGSDATRISELQSDELVSLKDLGIFLLIVWFMMEFNNVVPSIARKIGGTPQSFADLASAGNSMGGSLMKWGGKTALAPVNFAYKKVSGGRDIYMDARLATKRINTIRDAAVVKAGEAKNAALTTIDNKLSNGPAPIRGLYKAAKFAKGALSPEDALSSGLTKIGQNTTGRLLQKKDQAQEFVKGLGEHVGGKASDALESVADKAKKAAIDFKNNPIGTLKAAKNTVGGALSSAKNSMTARMGLKGTPTTPLPGGTTTPQGSMAPSGSAPRPSADLSAPKGWTPPPPLFDPHDAASRAPKAPDTKGGSKPTGDKKGSSSGGSTPR